MSNEQPPAIAEAQVSSAPAFKSQVQLYANAFGNDISAEVPLSFGHVTFRGQRPVDMTAEQLKSLVAGALAQAAVYVEETTIA